MFLSRKLLGRRDILLGLLQVEKAQAACPQKMSCLRQKTFRGSKKNRAREVKTYSTGAGLRIQRKQNLSSFLFFQKKKNSYGTYK